MAFDVLATAGVPRLGGEDFDNRVVNKQYKKTGTDVLKNLRSLGKLSERSRKLDFFQPAKYSRRDQKH
jgi:molecular chaperone DnaK (HSP70)